MLQNARVRAFTVPELLRENQLGGSIKLPPPPEIRVKAFTKSFEAPQRSVKLKF